jgi:hypothetical protein
MSYFKVRGGLGLDKSQFGIQEGSVQTTFEKTGTATAVDPAEAERVAAFDRLKAGWPRCDLVVKKPGGTSFMDMMTVSGYKYSFQNGEVRCTPEWDQNFYSMVVKGESPPPIIPNLRALNAHEHKKWVCRAQGTPHIQKAFEDQGLRWWGFEDKEKFQSHSHSHAPIPRGDIRTPEESRPIAECARYIAAQHEINVDRIEKWKAEGKDFTAPDYNDPLVRQKEFAQLAHHFQTVMIPEQVAAKESGVRTAEHRAHGCAGQVPPQLVGACEEWLSGRGRGGMTPADFMQALQDMEQEELNKLIAEGGPQGRGGIPPLLIYGGVAAVVGLVAWKVLGKKK